jgi:lipopolysaccharide/colanic/teichoic acid biosynthesis glycosyltransferase
MRGRPARRSAAIRSGTISNRDGAKRTDWPSPFGRPGEAAQHLFRQRRVGREGVDFEMLKLRTMWESPEEDGEADADWAERELGRGTQGAEEAPLPGSGRETRVGRVLRTTGVDELPQLVNVLRGEMSLVGPHPERKAYVSRFEPVIHG